MPTVVISENTTRDFAGVEDAQIKQNDSATNYSSSANFEVIAWFIGDNNRALVKFSGLSNIPANAVVSSATIDLYLENYLAGTGNATIDVHRVLRATNISQSSWNEYSSGNSWATAGGRGTGDSDAASASLVVGTTTATYQSLSNAGILADVQAWIDGSVTNNGWILKHNLDPAVADPNTGFVFSSSQDTDGQRPKLTVTYSIPTATGRGLLLGVG